MILRESLKLLRIHFLFYYRESIVEMDHIVEAMRGLSNICGCSYSAEQYLEFKDQICGLKYFIDKVVNIWISFLIQFEGC